VDLAKIQGIHDWTSLTIQVDIGGHPPIPLARKTVFHLGSFSTVFWVPNFWGRFEALNDVFWGFGAQVTIEALTWASRKFFFSVIPFQRAIVRLKQDRMQKLRPRKLMY
jgi:hypothetical protein